MTLQLRTLGAMDLRADAGEVRAVLQQPKRFALLVFLARSSRHRFIRRDTLLAHFWPELDQEHARAALRRALYFLRRALGDDVIAGRGDEEVGLADGAVSTDVEEFEAALARGDRRGALGLYGGDLLPGFYVSGAPEVERWIDGERERLRRAAAAAAWTLAESSATPASEAPEWAARAVQYSPDDESAVRRQMELLDRLGDRAGALRAFEALTRRLVADDVEPESETEALAARLRVRPAAPRPATLGRDLVLAVLPFAVSGSTALEFLCTGMPDLIFTALDGVDGLRVVDPRALQASLDTAPVPAVERLAATHTVRGSVVEAGGRLRISASLEESGGRIIGRVQADGTSDGQLFEMVDDLVRQLLALRAGAPAERLAHLAARATTSLAALKAYYRGEQPFRLGRYRDAAPAFEEAGQIDPSFALAFYRLAGTRAALAQPELAREASALAMTHRARLADHDRLLVEAQHAWLAGRPAEAERLYEEVLLDHPDDLESWYLLGDVIFHANPYRGRSIREAREPLERALALDPSHVGALAKLARLDALEDCHPDLDARVERYLQLSPDADQSLAMRALRAYCLGRTVEKASLVAALRHARVLSVAIAFGDVAMYSGALDELEPVGRAMLTAVRSSDLRALCRLMLAHVMLARGRHDAARAELEAASADDAPWALEVRGLLVAMPFWPWDAAYVAETTAALTAFDPASAPVHAGAPLALHNGLHGHIRAYLLGLLAARARDGQALADAAEQLEELDVPPGTATVVERMARTLAALVRRLKGDVPGALAALEGARSDVWYQTAVGSPIFGGTYERYLRAELLSESGRTKEAAGWLAAIGERSPWELPFVGPAGKLAEQLKPEG